MEAQEVTDWHQVTPLDSLMVDYKGQSSQLQNRVMSDTYNIG